MSRLSCLIVAVVAVQVAVAATMTEIDLSEIPGALASGPVLLMFRHGQSEHNTCQIFDHLYYNMLMKNVPIADALRLLCFNPSLTQDGVVQARAVGDAIRRSGLGLHDLAKKGKAEFWTSTMARTIETAATALPDFEFRASDQLQGKYAGIASGLRHSSGASTATAFKRNGLTEVLRNFQQSGISGISGALGVNANDAIVNAVQERVHSMLLELDSGRSRRFGSLQDTIKSLDIKLDCGQLPTVDPHFPEFNSSETDEQYMERLRIWLTRTVTEPKLYVVSSHMHSVENILSLGGLSGYNVGNGACVCVAYQPGASSSSPSCRL